MIQMSVCILDWSYIRSITDNAIMPHIQESLEFMEVHNVNIIEMISAIFSDFMLY